jgi:endonuclease/exonuclease/phosphatase family metal-dependent hydrolase
MTPPFGTGPTRARAIAYTLFALLVACDVPEPPHAGAQERERVVLRATSPAGVPLHPDERSSAVSGRIADGTEVEVVRWAEDRRWLEVRAIDGTRGWITARYVAPQGTAARGPDPWSSREACLAALASVPRRDPARVRLASWNLRWFPDGSSGGPSATPTDVDWAACILATLRVDAIALQEIQLHARGLLAVDRLRERLAAHNGGTWEARFDTCPRDGRQHVGWLVDTSRARIVDTEQLDAVNPRGGCTNNLRPGLAAYVRFARGLDVSLVVAHLDSGQSPRDHGHRAASFGALVQAARALADRHGDADVLVLGDLNTMGCDECTPRIDAASETAALDVALSPSIRRLNGDVPCTELYRGRGSLLDHVLATTRTTELARDARVEVHGPCAQHRCQLPRGARPPMLEHLSDHCPIVVELENADRDGVEGDRTARDRTR